jgi:glycerol-3-phosphate acyltransferase PlsY
VVTLLLSKFASLASTVVTVCAFITGVILYFVGVPEIDLYYVIITFLLMLLILFKHRSNFKRILAGNENKIVFKKKK